MEKKNRATPRQLEAVRAQRANGARLREWLHDRTTARIKRRKRDRKRARAVGGGHGKTRKLNKLPGVRREWVHHHEGGMTPRERRVRYPGVGGEYEPYRNPARYDDTVGTERERRIARNRAERLRKEVRA